MIIIVHVIVSGSFLSYNIFIIRGNILVKFGNAILLSLMLVLSDYLTAQEMVVVIMAILFMTIHT